MKWYFETCKLSHILLLGIVVWALSATLLLGKIAPLVYIGLHLVTTGVFFLAFLRIDSRARKSQPPTDA
jgi:hypothetical protein